MTSAFVREYCRSHFQLCPSNISISNEQHTTIQRYKVHAKEKKGKKKRDAKEAGEGGQVQIGSEQRIERRPGGVWEPCGREVCKCESTFISAPRPCISWELPDALSAANRIPAPRAFPPPAILPATHTHTYINTIRTYIGGLYACVPPVRYSGDLRAN